jgi:hypothetical protein
MEGKYNTPLVEFLPNGSFTGIGSLLKSLNVTLNATPLIGNAPMQLATPSPYRGHGNMQTFLWKKYSPGSDYEFGYCRQILGH